MKDSVSYNHFCVEFCSKIVFVHMQVEQVSQLSSFVESLLQYHREASQILEELSGKLQERLVPTIFGRRRAFCMLRLCLLTPDM